LPVFYFLNFIKASECPLFILIDATFNIAEFDLHRINVALQQQNSGFAFLLVFLFLLFTLEVLKFCKGILNV